MTLRVYWYLVTPRPIDTHPSPDGLYRCVLSQSPWDRITLGDQPEFRVEDAFGHILPGGNFGQVYVAGITRYDQMFVASNLSSPSVIGICHHGKIYSESDLTTITSDKSLAELADCKNLHHLTIFGPGVTDAGLAHLHRSGGLVTLCLDHAAVTMDGLRSLHQARKNLEIFESPAATQPISFEQ